MRMRSIFFQSFSLFLLLTSVGYCSGSSEVFVKYPNSYFVESRAYKGKAIQCALDAGFSHVRSIESSEKDYERVKRLFKRNQRVQIFHGKSSKILKEVIQDICEPITFWLDLYDASEGTKQLRDFSLIEDLNQIANHPIKTHTLLIDDVKMLNKPDSYCMTLNDVIARILKINPDYCFEFEKGDHENDILVAFIDDEL